MMLLLAALLAQADPGKLGKLAYAEFAEKLPLKAGERAATVCHPKDADKPVPVIVLSPGGQAESPAGYEGFGRWWASWGYATVIVGFDSDTAEERAGQFGEVVDWLARKNAEPGWALKGKLDLKRVVASGHSRGGYAAVLAAAKDKRFAACVAMAPSGPEKLEGDAKPAWCFISGDGGDEEVCGRLMKEASGARVNVTVEGMDHFFQPRGKAEVVIKYATAFLNWKVKGDEEYRGFFKTVDDVKVRVEEK